MIELTLSFHPDSKIPHYEQLYLFIRQEIQSGRIKPGTRLPSIRGLSEALKISKTTTEEAYQQLIAEGYIASKERIGYFSLQPEDAFHEPEARLLRQSSDVISNSDHSTDIDFHPARVDGDHFPFAIFRKLSNESWKNLDPLLMNYGEHLGEWGRRKHLVDYLQHARGVRCIPDQIIIGSGIQFSIHFLINLMRNEATVVGMEEPGYEKVLAVFQREGVPIRPITLESDGIDIEALRDSDASLVYVTPSHQFPQGMVMPYYKRMKLLQWAHDKAGYIIEDDYDGEFRYGERPIPSLQGLDGNQKVIYIGTFSKSLAPSLRVNYMVLPTHLLHQAESKLQKWDSPVSKIHQLLLQRFMEMGYWEKHIRRVRRIYRSKHAILMQSIRAEMGKHATIIGHGAGLHVLVDLHTNTSKEVLSGLAEAVGVKVYFVSGHEHSPRMMLGFGGLSPEKMVEGMKRLRLCWFG